MNRNNQPQKYLPSWFVLNFFKIFLFIMIPSIYILAQTEGEYRSHQSGNWSDVNSWERYDGTKWVTPVTVVPSSIDNVIMIQTNHNIKADNSYTIDQTIVNTGASLEVIAGKTLTISDGADSIDVIIKGSIMNYGIITPTGRISIESGATFYSRVSGGGTLPTSTWRDGSTCQIDSVASTVANVTSQKFYNFTWNGTKQNANVGLNFPDGTVFRGNVTIMSTNGNTRQWRFANLSSGTTRNIYIKGDVIVNGPNAMLTSTGSAGTDTTAFLNIYVDGNIIVSAGVLNICSTANPFCEWKVKGDVIVSGGSLTANTTKSPGPWHRKLTFVKNGTQNFTVSGTGSIGAALNFRTANTATVVQVNFPWALNGILSLDSGKVVTSNTNILTVQAGSTVTSGSTSGYVDGPMIRTLASNTPTVLNFPIGKSSAFRPVNLNIAQDAATSTTYRAEIFNAKPTTRAIPQTLDAISSVRYLNLVKGEGASVTSFTIEMSYDADDKINNKDSVRIARDDGVGNWINSGGSGTANAKGTITSNVLSTLNANTDFVLAHASANAVIGLPTLTTTPIDAQYISTTTASSGGNITNDGGGAISSRGVCWNTSGSPAINDSKTTNGSGTGIFTSSLTGLLAGTKYYVRAYASNSSGTGYGNEVTFTTLVALVVPTVSTAEISNISGNTASSGGNVAAWGGTSVTERGVCWSKQHNPTTADEKTMSGTGLGIFTSAIGGLDYGSTYYVRAYAVNSTGTGYGNEVSFSTPAAQPNITKIVSKDGKGDYSSVQAAFRAVPTNYTGKWTIFIRKGKYYELDTLATNKNNVTLIGEDRDSTILVYDNYANSGARNPSSTINGNDFTAMNLTFQNTSHDIAQALALETNGDRMAFYNCKILGYQDTYLGNGLGRVYFKNCFIEGTVDFIYGRSIMVFDSCTVKELRDGGYLTAASTEPTEKFGINFLDCTITNDPIGYNGNPINSFYLGRPWQAQPRVVFVRCYEPATVNTAGWTTMSVTPALYAEYNCTGPGFKPTQRTTMWGNAVRQLTDKEALDYTVQNIFSKYSISPAFASNWIPAKPTLNFPTSICQNSKEIIPTEIELYQNYPNPFNPTTIIKFAIPQDGRYSLKIYNTLGQEVATFLDDEISAGVHRINFDAGRLSSGVYIYRLIGKNVNLIRKMVLVK